MKLKRIILFLLLVVFVCVGSSLIFAQEYALPLALAVAPSYSVTIPTVTFPPFDLTQPTQIAPFDITISNALLEPNASVTVSVKPTNTFTLSQGDAIIPFSLSNGITSVNLSNPVFCTFRNGASLGNSIAIVNGFGSTSGGSISINTADIHFAGTFSGALTFECTYTPFIG